MEVKIQKQVETRVAKIRKDMTIEFEKKMSAANRGRKKDVSLKKESKKEITDIVAKK